MLLPLSLLLLVMELRPPARPPALLLVSDGARGRVQVSLKSVQSIAARAGLEVAGVLDMNSRIAVGRHGLSVRAKVEVDPASEIPNLAGEVQERVKRAVESYLGRSVSEWTRV